MPVPSTLSSLPSSFFSVRSSSSIFSEQVKALITEFMIISPQPNSTLCLIGFQANNKEALHYWPFVRGIHQSTSDSPHKGPVIWKHIHVTTIEQPNMVPIIYWQYHACWCPGDLKSQAISRLDIDLISQNIQSPASEELSTLDICYITLCDTSSKLKSLSSISI